MPLMDIFNKVTQDVARSTRGFVDLTLQNSIISEEQKKIIGLYEQIGKLYYETNVPDIETPIGQLCLAINAAYEKITKCNETISQIKKTRKCPSCNTEIQGDIIFCGSCGAKIEVNSENQQESFSTTGNELRKCLECGLEMQNEAKFCPHCGNAPKKCPECGKELSSKIKFCPDCGYNMNIE